MTKPYCGPRDTPTYVWATDEGVDWFKAGARLRNLQVAARDRKWNQAEREEVAAIDDEMSNSPAYNA